MKMIENSSYSDRNFCGDIIIRKKNNFVFIWIIATIFIISFINLMIISFESSQNKYPNYYFENLNISKLWERSMGCTQTIAIIDTGITDEAKLIFENNIIGVYNSINSSINVLDEHGITHGTQMASLIVGSGVSGVYGIAPNANLLIIRAFEGPNSRTNDEILARAVDYAVNHNVDVINLSFGSFQSNYYLEQAINRAVDANIIVVASTGDYGNRDSLFPARMGNVVSVRAKDSNGNFWRYSNIGDGDIMSMYGVDMLALTNNNKQIIMSGTSQATALASGYIALIRDYHYRNGRNFNNEEIFKKTLFTKFQLSKCCRLLNSF